MAQNLDFNPTPEMAAFLHDQVLYYTPVDGKTTLGSSLRRIRQMDEYTIQCLSPELVDADKKALVLEIESLVDAFGDDFTVADHLVLQSDIRMGR